MRDQDFGRHRAAQVYAEVDYTNHTNVPDNRQAMPSTEDARD